jgi:hypothetical protein
VFFILLFVYFVTVDFCFSITIVLIFFCNYEHGSMLICGLLLYFFHLPSHIFSFMVFF